MLYFISYLCDSVAHIYAKCTRTHTHWQFDFLRKSIHSLVSMQTQAKKSSFCVVPVAASALWSLRHVTTWRCQCYWLVAQHRTRERIFWTLTTTTTYLCNVYMNKQAERRENDGGCQICIYYIIARCKCISQVQHFMFLLHITTVPLIFFSICRQTKLWMSFGGKTRSGDVNGAVYFLNLVGKAMWGNRKSKIVDVISGN